MAEALVVRIGDLLPEFLADALVVLRPLQTAGAVAAGALETFPDGSHHFLIIIQPNSHVKHFLSDIIIKESAPLSR